MKYNFIVEEFVQAYPGVIDNRKYILFSPAEDPEYKILLFRTVLEVHCYYSGYGKLTRKRKLNEFDSPEEIMEWALSQMNQMEVTPLTSIDRIFLGLEDDDEEEFDED